MPLALITWLDSGPGAGPPGIWGPTDPRPTPPIANPGRPPWWNMATDPGYSPPWARPGQPVYPDNSLPGNQPYPDQGLPGNQPYPDNSLPGRQPRPDQGLPPFATNLPVFPPQHPIVAPGDPTKGYLVAYVPKSGGGYERITFTIDMPEEGPPPTEATPKA